MQSVCDQAGVQLWPHIKTHKCVEIARRQLALGAAGLTCAKLSEAEAMLPSGVKRIFWAHSLATPAALVRANSLRRQLDDLVIAVTSLAHAQALVALLDAAAGGATGGAGRPWSVAVAVDTGLGREGLRSLEEARALRALLAGHAARVHPVAIYTHEGHAYATPREKLAGLVDRAYARLLEFREVLGGELPLWPGCSVSAKAFAGREHVAVVRPGAYVFGDLYLSEPVGACRRSEVALVVRATVVDRPECGLALIDAGTKTFGSDRLTEGAVSVFARPADGRDLAVTRLSEEHGFVTGAAVDSLQIGDVIDWIPAHVCPVVNLARELVIVNNDGSAVRWPVDAGGCNW
ncbi:hypothetical protein OPIT5_23765 [Opitutaceae bacterium TAV5]|nr:hypothetical protein OPIT5_23765 [Opitutaceae bacterium TAV5]